MIARRIHKTLLLTLLTFTAALAQQPKFIIADVHASTTSHNFAQNFGGVLRGGLYINRDATVLDLIQAAYHLTEDSISGGPGWIASDLFDVVAKVPDATTSATANLMLQSLLQERFSLVVRSGTSPVPRFVLTVGKGGSKLKPASGSGKDGCQPQQQSGGPGTPGDPASIPNIKVVCRNLTAEAIAENLHQMAGGYLTHDLIDSTKLEGSWDFDIEWTARGALAAKGADGISIFDAVDKQLGLKLEVQDVPLPSLLVVSVNRKPTPNPDGIGTSLGVAAARFEAASIKPASPDAPHRVQFLYTGGSQITAKGTLRDFISMALQISPNIAGDTVIGLPKSVDSQSWDITAKVPATGEGAPNIVGGRPQPPPLSVGLEMLRGLLIDQFELKFHTENREVTVYAMTLGTGKPKLTRADDSERVGCKPDPTAAKPVPNIAVMIACKNTSMTELANNLTQQANAYIDHPIVDATGLTDGWDFLIGWTPKAALVTAQAAGSGAEPSDPGGMTVFEAVDKELGLKLVKQKRSIPVIVIDHVAEKPVE